MSQATRATDFLSTLAVNTHFDQAGQYDDLTQGIASLNYIGIKIIRLGAPTSSGDYAEAEALAKAGMKFNLVVHPEVSPQANITAIHNFVAAHPGAVLSIEGPNEVDLWPVNYNGQSGMAAAQAYQQVVYDLVNADPLLKDLPVYNFSWGVGAPNQTGASDVTNVHAYMPYGNQPSKDMSWWLDYATDAMPGKPVVITESGYFTLPHWEDWQGVDQATQAKGILNEYFRNDAYGVQRTFMYQLLDQYQDPSGTNREAHFGMFDVNFQAKTVATALHNLTTILADTSASAGSFATHNLNYTVSGLPSNGGTKLMEKASGAYDLAVWAEPDIWNEDTNQPITAPTTQVTVNLGATFSTVQVYDPLKGTTAQQVLHDVSQVTLGVSDHPLIIEMSNATSTAGSSGSGTTTTGGTTTGGTTATTPAATTANLSVGSGSDSLVLKVSQDAYQGSAQYTISVDGKQVGGTLTATALYSAGLSDTVTVKGDWAAGAHTVSVNFLNDLYGGLSAADRNLHVTSATYNGKAVSGATLWLGDTGPESFGFTEAAAATGGTTTGGTTTTTPAATTANLSVGSGSDSLVLKVSQDAYQGSAQYTISVDGQQVGGTLTATALYSAGLSDTVTVKGDWAAGAHTVSVNFLNDLYGGSSTTDRNLHVTEATYNGKAVSGATLWLGDTGPESFGFTEAAAATTLTGTAAANKLSGGSQAESITALAGNDTVHGWAGNDTVNGGAGTDVLYGDTGNDLIIGGAAADTTTGGAGADIFAFTARTDAGDAITDFSVASGDRLDISALFPTGPDTGPALLDGGYVRFVQMDWGTRVQVDLDGGANSWTTLVTLNGLTASALKADILIA
ncbi:carbohydrate-binding domain-containing protein [Roseicella aquatilis]|uniref:Type I secretion C-terminal target domain-containing protein n=1 Tax=Roseicella aquatilis TaxID=2527868 RepID=A0A4R4DTX8_9PROT|nr:carbohydrate-binding domain-containing protein [Roseicella aquatilis]TCZ63633.1 type I secretion C-terminal target domain-containing protein [Roseicella aquatilis]